MIIPHKRNSDRNLFTFQFDQKKKKKRKHSLYVNVFQPLYFRGFRISYLFKSTDLILLLGLNIFSWYYYFFFNS